MWTERKNWLFEASHSYSNRRHMLEEILGKDNLKCIKTPSLYKEYEKQEIVFITQSDEEYPESFREMYDPPLYFYAKGNLTLLRKKMIAIVGARQCNKGIDRLMQPIIKQLVAADVGIVSGLATGIDTHAHRITLIEKGDTIAVLGSGMYRLYPQENALLYNYMLRKELVISEYAPPISARKWTFVERNRLVSALSQGVWVVEAAEKSGSLITVDYALDEGKSIFATPGSPLNKQAVGCNRLLQEGAILVISADDILRELT
ncbi:DNA-processing protein DprA [Brochothrix thermosphacta]|uniref:DNA-processing protein DprA n=1 Tax=Brochothrix thermosphacta TaxID=2756 RepID=UPI00265D6029|nr:DNA-processing protein DprA [Brochothrix thermosphacta]WKK69995.1 DNA-processing protein DprA [Brochothrix thermosphacta]